MAELEESPSPRVGVNGKVRCLNSHWFLSLANTREKLGGLARCYNVDQPHTRIGNKPPIKLIDWSTAYGPR